MSDQQDKCWDAVARLVNAAADALVSYTRLQEKREKYLDEASAQVTQGSTDPAFEQFKPGYFEKTYGPKSPEAKS